MLWVKSFHIIAMVSWFAGLFYLPRIFVYHTRHPNGPTHEQFCEMERKLYRFIMNPAMIATTVLGVWLTVLMWDYLHPRGWFVAKMVLVAALFAFHLACGRWLRDFAEGRNARPERFFRMANEVPTLILIGAVCLVVLKPF